MGTPSWLTRPKAKAADGTGVLARPLQLYARMKGREAYWELSRTTGHLLHDKHGMDMLAGDVISFSEEDDRDTEAGPKDGIKVLSRRIMADIGTDVVYIHEGKRDGWFYATPVSRVKTAPAGTRIYSGRQILRSMLREAKVAPQEPFVVGVAFSGTPTTAVVMFVSDGSGRLGNMQYVPVAGDDLRTAIKGFVQGARLAASGEFPDDRILIFEGEHLAKLLHSYKPYPSEPLLMGVPVSQWDRAALAASSVLLCGVTGFGAWQFWSATRDTREAAALRTQSAQAQDRIKAALNERLDGLLRNGSVPVDRAIDVAGKVYRDGARVELQADRTQLFAKLVTKLDDPNNTSETIKLLLAGPVPQGCGRRPLDTNKTLSEVYLTYECPSVDSLAADLLGTDR